MLFPSIFAYYFLKLHLHHKKVIKKSQNKRNQGFSYYFCFMIEGLGSGSRTKGSGSGAPKTYGSYGSGSATLVSTLSSLALNQPVSSAFNQSVSQNEYFQKDCHYKSIFFNFCPYEFDEFLPLKMPKKTKAFAGFNENSEHKQKFIHKYHNNNDLNLLSKVSAQRGHKIFVIIFLIRKKHKKQVKR
jgi:hypothetical protein